MRQADEALVLKGVAGACLLALLLRLWPAVAGLPLLAEGWVTEDGYLMLTVARNLALGLGLSVSDGTIPTNGVQPLAAFLYALPYALTGGDKLAGLALLHGLWAAIAVAGALAVRAFAGRVLGALGMAPAWAWLAAGLWFCGPLLIGHSMNGLETGLYTLTILLACLQFLRLVERGAAARPRDLMLMAGLLGLVFLARNDGVFLIFALLAIWLWHARSRLGQAPATILRSLALPLLVCLAVVAPWLIHNQLFFGSIVPISGTAQSVGVGIGSNLPNLPAVLFENMAPMLPIPNRIETWPAVIALSGFAVVAVLAAFLRLVWRAGGAVWLVVLAYLLHGLALAGYYGLFFGAPHFLARYTAPLAPLLIVALLAVGWQLAERLARSGAARAMTLAGLAALVLSLGLSVRALVADQGHVQVVRWVEANVPAEDWVGAVQTGTLGYWHDRTINLDGKVNPQALQARREIGHVLHYVAASEIAWLADWSGIAGWVDREGFGAYFEVIVNDPAANLAVLRRR